MISLDDIGGYSHTFAGMKVYILPDDSYYMSDIPNGNIGIVDDLIYCRSSDWPVLKYLLSEYMASNTVKDQK
jgi:hypothetical protein